MTVNRQIEDAKSSWILARIFGDIQSDDIRVARDCYLKGFAAGVEYRVNDFAHLRKRLHASENENAKMTERLEAENQWIRCDERLPEDEGERLVTILHYYTHEPVTTSGFYSSGMWREEDGEPVIVPVTAWRPMPAPYKEGL